MHFTVVREHREFFRNHHWIECEAVLSSEELKRISEGIPRVLKERTEAKVIQAGSSAYSKAIDKNGFEEGHDLWRGSGQLKKIILGSGLAGIAGELIEQRPLRIGYDTLFPAVSKNPGKNTYESFLKTHPALHEMSCIQGVLCGAMVCVSSDGEITAQESSTTIFSKTLGNAVFFSPDWPLPLDEIYQNPGFTYLLIVYVKVNAVYLSKQGDPHLHHFKRLGYNFGDRLKEPFHPVVYC